MNFPEFFALVMNFFISLLAAFGVAYLLETVPDKKEEMGGGAQSAAALIFFIFLEYVLPSLYCP